jgi:hypothetical protein
MAGTHGRAKPLSQWPESEKQEQNRAEVPQSPSRSCPQLSENLALGLIS